MNIYIYIYFLFIYLFNIVILIKGRYQRFMGVLLDVSDYCCNYDMYIFC